MDFGISGSVAMVAAASKGIGYATAKLLTEEGCRVSICGRTAESLDRAASELGCFAFKCDVASETDLNAWVGATVAHFGPPQILVTNTGGPPAGLLASMSDEHWKSGFESTMMNVVRLVRLVNPLMTQGWGRIVHVTSLVAKEPSDMLPISSTLRAGLCALTRLQSNELATRGITVNSVLPGHTMTDRQVHLAELTSKTKGISVQEALDSQASKIPVGRMAGPDEIAAAIVFLCSRQASFISGENLVVDGGLIRGCL